jgi:hypothetical protein
MVYGEMSNTRPIYLKGNVEIYFLNMFKYIMGNNYWVVILI